MSDFLLIVLAALTASVLGLTVHIYVQKWSTKKLPSVVGGYEQKLNYSSTIKVAAYMTAFMSTMMLTFIYYYVGILLNVGGTLLNALLFSMILLEIKGKLFREPVMNYIFFRESGIKRPLYAVFLTYADQWASGLILGSSIVLLCPVK